MFPCHIFECACDVSFLFFSENNCWYLLFTFKRSVTGMQNKSERRAARLLPGACCRRIGEKGTSGAYRRTFQNADGKVQGRPVALRVRTQSPSSCTCRRARMEKSCSRKFQTLSSMFLCECFNGRCRKVSDRYLALHLL